MAVVMITGSRGGFGRALTRAFADAKYDLILHSRTKAPSLAIKSKCKFVVGNLHESRTVGKLNKAATEWGLDVLVNNAAHRPPTGPFWGMPRDEVWDSVHGVGGLFDLTAEVWPLLKTSRGCVVNIGSIGAKIATDGEGVYGAAKAAVAQFSKGIQFEATRCDVRVLLVQLGAMNTGMAEGRPDQDKLINADEAARAVCSMCEIRFDTIRMPEVVLERKNY